MSKKPVYAAVVEANRRAQREVAASLGLKLKSEARRRYAVRCAITDRELRGLSFLADSLGEHIKQDLGTGDAEGDEQAREAMRWVGRMTSYAYAHPLRRAAGRADRKGSR